MSEKVKIAVAPPIQVGGSLFTPAQLALIGTIAGNDAAIEMTPFKQLYVEISSYRKDKVVEELQDAGLEVYPAGFIAKNLYACNFCKGAADAGLDTARKLNNAVAGIVTPTPLKVGYAGCALGTSEPLLKDIGVVKMRDRYDIYVGGDPKGLKAALGVLLISDISEEQLTPTVMAIVYDYIDHAKGKEKFGKYINRVGISHLKIIVGNIAV